MNDFKITPIEQEGQRVLTTAQLAEAYGTDSKIITKNFSRNSDRYIEGVHFYRLTGNALREFKTAKRQIDVLPNVNTLYLWTERGALLHAKSLNTDKAWEVYEFLVDTYFRAREMNKFYNEKIYQKLELLEQKVNILDNKIDTLEKNSGDRTNNIIEKIEKSLIETSYITAQVLIPCFEYLNKRLKKVYKNMKGKN